MIFIKKVIWSFKLYFCSPPSSDGHTQTLQSIYLIRELLFILFNLFGNWKSLMPSHIPHDLCHVIVDWSFSSCTFSKFQHQPAELVVQTTMRSGVSLLKSRLPGTCSTSSYFNCFRICLMHAGRQKRFPILEVSEEKLLRKLLDI